MKGMRKIITAIVSTKPRIVVGPVRADGNVSFDVRVKDCGLTKGDCANPIMATKFMVNFIGELLVRDNIDKFAPIVNGFDKAVYEKIVGDVVHADFGMATDAKLSCMTFHMHLSLVSNIMTEDFRRTEECDAGLISLGDNPPLFGGPDDGSKDKEE